MQIIMNEASRMNPLYPLPGENWPILSTGLTMSMSTEWFQDSTDGVAIDYKDPPTIYDQITKTTFNILGKAKFLLPRDPNFLIAEIQARLVYGLDVMALGNLKF